MACGATLKRPLEFDPLHSPASKSPKRRRCTPMSPMQSSSPGRLAAPSPFADCASKLTTDQIAAKLNAEIKLLHRRRRLAAGYPSSPSPPRSMSPPEGMSPARMSPTPSTSSAVDAVADSSYPNAPSPGKRDVPLFTFRQMSMVCSRMLQEREEQLRETYDKVLAAKLAEQYESFLKFNYDVIQRRLTERPASYVS